MFRIKDRYELDLRVLGFSTTSNINWLNLKNEIRNHEFEEESSNTEFVKWTEEDFCDRDTCYFCKTKNDGDWDESCEDAVCVECSDKWEYLDDYCGEGYYRECYDCGACGKCKEWNTDSEEWNTDKEEEDECDDCEGKCKSNETEKCDDCGVELRIGCANNPSDHSIFNDYCDDCRVE